jgi:hypothetical protein
MMKEGRGERQSQGGLPLQEAEASFWCEDASVVCFLFIFFYSHNTLIIVNCSAGTFCIFL